MLKAKNKTHLNMALPNKWCHLINVNIYDFDTKAIIKKLTKIASVNGLAILTQICFNFGNIDDNKIPIKHGPTVTNRFRNSFENGIVIKAFSENTVPKVYNHAGNTTKLKNK